MNEKQKINLSIFDAYIGDGPDSPSIYEFYIPYRSIDKEERINFTAIYKDRNAEVACFGKIQFDNSVEITYNLSVDEHEIESVSRCFPDAYNCYSAHLSIVKDLFRSLASMNKTSSENLRNLFGKQKRTMQAIAEMLGFMGEKTIFPDSTEVVQNLEHISYSYFWEFSPTNYIKLYFCYPTRSTTNAYVAVISSEDAPTYSAYLELTKDEPEKIAVGMSSIKNVLSYLLQKQGDGYGQDDNLEIGDCPWCGSEAEICGTHVICTSEECYAFGPFGEDKEGAINLWNKVAKNVCS